MVSPITSLADLSDEELAHQGHAHATALMAIQAEQVRRATRAALVRRDCAEALRLAEVISPGAYARERGLARSTVARWAPGGQARPRGEWAELEKQKRRRQK